jgi:hypothetical protein
MPDSVNPLGARSAVQKAIRERKLRPSRIESLGRFRDMEPAVEDIAERLRDRDHVAGLRGKPARADADR